jgi:hypothetical protein
VRKIYVTVKSIAKKKSYITKKELALPRNPQTLRDLITDIVKQTAQQFNQKNTDIPLVDYLSKNDIELQRASGKIGFSTKYREDAVDEDGAVLTAISAFEDGLYKVFVGESEIEKLDEPLDCKDSDEVAFIKLTMLAGRMW